MKSQNQFFEFLLLSTVQIISCFIILTSYSLIKQTNQTKLANQIQEVSDWQTYKNNEFNFKYPTFWPEPVRYQQSTRYELDFNSTLFISSGSFYNQIEQRELTMEEYVSNFNRKSEDIRLDILFGKRFSYLAADNKQEIDIVLANSLSSPNIYVISYKYDPNDTVALKVINQILSTFKFIDPKNPKNQRKMVPALSVYNINKLSSDDKEMLSNLKWPELKSFKSTDSEREVYLVDCIVTAKSFELMGIPTLVPNTKNIAEVTLKKLLSNNVGGFPSAKDIALQEDIFGSKYKNPVSGINGIILRPDGNLEINFYDSVAAYGGGSSRVGCMASAVYFSAIQFPAIKSVTMCIDKYPNKSNNYCAYDFQP